MTKAKRRIKCPFCLWTVVQCDVHRMEDIPGKSVNNYKFGLKTNLLEVKLEAVE